MSSPSALSTHIGSVLCFVSGTTRRAFLGGVGRVLLLDRDAKPCRFVGDEQGELREAPRILHPVVFAGSCPTTGACRALAYSCKRLYFDRPYALFEGMIDDLARKLVVDILHPTGFFALTFLDGSCFLGPLELPPAGIETTAHLSLVPTLAKEAGSLPSDVSYRRHLDPKINPHDAFLRDRRGFSLGHGHISNPLAPLLLDAQETWQAHKLHFSTSDLDLLHLAIQGDRQGELALVDLPVLIVPRADRFLEHGERL